MRRLGLEDRIIVRENILEIEDYLQAADLALYTSENESFCLSILEAMFFGCPSVATCIGGIPEVVQDGVTGMLVSSSDPDMLARSVERVIQNASFRAALGLAAQARAVEKFSANAIVPRYENLYRRVCGGEKASP